MKAQGINNSDLKVKGPTKNKTKTKILNDWAIPKKNVYTRDAVKTCEITSCGCDF